MNSQIYIDCPPTSSQSPEIEDFTIHILQNENLNLFIL